MRSASRARSPRFCLILASRSWCSRSSAASRCGACCTARAAPAEPEPRGGFPDESAFFGLDGPLGRRVEPDDMARTISRQSARSNGFVSRCAARSLVLPASEWLEDEVATCCPEPAACSSPKRTTQHSSTSSRTHQLATHFPEDPNRCCQSHARSIIRDCRAFSKNSSARRRPRSSVRAFFAPRDRRGRLPRIAQ